LADPGWLKATKETVTAMDFISFVALSDNENLTLFPPITGT
jgi:hypothetical protein